jgi:hypothetical protein
MMLRIVLISSAAALILLVACGRGERVMEPRHRFVDLRLGAQESGRLPVATIRDETRYVLPGYPQGQVMAGFGLPVPADGHLSARRKLPKLLEGGSRVVMVSRARYQGNLAPWISLPQVIQRIERTAQGEFVQLQLDLPSGAAGSKADIHVMGYVPPERPRNAYDTPGVEIPLDSRLEFGVGIIEAVRGQGPVAFSLQVCEAGDCAAIFSDTLDPSDPNDLGWQDHVVVLDEYAGRTLSFRFETSLLRPVPGSFSQSGRTRPSTPRQSDAEERSTSS